MKKILVLILFAILRQSYAQGWYEASFIDTLIGARDICMINTDTGFVCGDDGFLAKTTDGGFKWDKVNSVPTTETLVDLFFPSHDTGYVVGYSAGYGGKILRTTDFGLSWTVMKTGTNPFFSCYFINSKTGYAVCGNEIWKTTNAGINWDSTIVSEYYFESIQFIDDETGYVSGEYMYKTTDGGASWFTQQSFPNNVWRIYFLNANVGFGLGNNGTVLKTMDGGNIWDTYNTGYIFPLRGISFINNNVGFAIGNPYLIYKSTDSGVTWGEQSSGTSWGVYMHTIHFLNEQTGFIVGLANGIWKGIVLKTTDGGATFVDDEMGRFNPHSFSLYQNYPNPFNPSTKISWQSPVGGWQTLKVYDVLGNKIATLVDEYKPAGNYEVEFNPNRHSRESGNLSSGISARGGYTSGVYFYQLKAGNYIETKKMLMIK